MKTPIILCVDDERFVLDSLKSALSSSFKDKLSVELAESAEEAIDLLSELISEGYEIPIVISDWLMPGMKGDEFLIEVQKILPKTRKILLTGLATTEGVGNAINNAKLYRYIAKPWDAEDLDLTVTEAFRSYYHKKKIEDQQKDLIKINESLEIRIQERTMDLDSKNKIVEDVLDKTLKGCASALLEIVTKSNIEVFEKTSRVKVITKKIGISIGFESMWELELAALLSQVGCLFIDNNTLKKFYGKGVLSNFEENVYKLHPLRTHEVLKDIPYFENIAEGILNMFSEDKSLRASYESASQALKISKILRVAHDFDQLITHGKSEAETLDILKRHSSTYDEYVVDALIFTPVTSNSNNTSADIQSLHVSDLMVGMVLATNVINHEGRILFTQNDEITADLLTSMTRLQKKNDVIEPIFVYC